MFNSKKKRNQQAEALHPPARTGAVSSGSGVIAVGAEVVSGGESRPANLKGFNELLYEMMSTVHGQAGGDGEVPTSMVFVQPGAAAKDGSFTLPSIQHAKQHTERSVMPREEVSKYSIGISTAGKDKSFSRVSIVFGKGKGEVIFRGDYDEDGVLLMVNRLPVQRSDAGVSISAASSDIIYTEQDSSLWADVKKEFQGLVDEINSTITEVAGLEAAISD